MATEIENDSATDWKTEVRADKWAALVGDWTFGTERCVYEGGDVAPGARQFGIARSAYAFRDGRISATITLSRSERTCGGLIIGFQSPTRHYFVLALGAFDRAYALVQFRPEFGWEPLEVTGTLTNLKAKTPYNVEAHVEGQKVRMTVDGVDVLEAVLQHPLNGSGFCLYAFDDAKVTFENVTLCARKPQAFVAMPFEEPFDTLYREVIAEVAEKECGFEINRVDEIAGPGIILDDIRRQIETSHVIVADVTSLNPNVFYEIGYAHALGKPVIILVRRNGDESSQNLPFDIRGYRAIYYDDTIGGKRRVEDALRKHFDALKDSFSHAANA
jgi:hypothetical protein